MNTQVRPRQVHRTKAELILHELRAQIFDGQLAPGRRLILREIAEEFGCSEIPVREALNSLASLGLVNLAPHEGARVSKINLTELIELTEVRLLLEREATLQAALAFPPDALKALEEILVRMDAALVDKNALEYGELNTIFHETIVSHCANAKMVSVIRDFREQTERGRAVHRFLPTHSRRSLKIHARIARAIASENREALAAVLDEHNKNILNSMRALPEEEAAAPVPKKRSSRTGKDPAAA